MAKKEEFKPKRRLRDRASAKLAALLSIPVVGVAAHQVGTVLFSDPPSRVDANKPPVPVLQRSGVPLQPGEQRNLLPIGRQSGPGGRTQYFGERPGDPVRRQGAAVEANAQNTAGLVAPQVSNGQPQLYVQLNVDGYPAGIRIDTLQVFLDNQEVDVTELNENGTVTSASVDCDDVVGGGELSVRGRLTNGATATMTATDLRETPSSRSATGRQCSAWSSSPASSYGGGLGR